MKLIYYGFDGAVICLDIHNMDIIEGNRPTIKYQFKEFLKTMGKAFDDNHDLYFEDECPNCEQLLSDWKCVNPNCMSSKNYWSV